MYPLLASAAVIGFATTMLPSGTPYELISFTLVPGAQEHVAASGLDVRNVVAYVA